MGTVARPHQHVTDAAAHVRARRRVERLPLPWEDEWSADERLLAATQFIRQLLEALHGSQVVIPPTPRTQTSAPPYG